MMAMFKIRPAAVPALLRIGVAVGMLGSAGAWAADPTPSAAQQQSEIEALQRQLQAVQTQLQQLAQQNRDLLAKQLAMEHAAVGTAGATPSAVSPPLGSSAPMALVPPGSSAAAAAGAGTAAGSVAGVGPGGAGAQPGAVGAFSNVRLWGYGEVYYTRPTHDAAKAQADLARAVFGIGYAFDARTEFNSEYEVEHAVTSSTDVGEFEVEQFYVDRQVNDALTVRAGLFLMPFGFLNEHHEPTTFYGVQRNFVESLIIPSTWREGGFNLHGETPVGLSWNAGLTTGFDLSKWNFAPEYPQYTTALDLANSHSAPLQSTHQELSLGNAHHLSEYVALGYYGISGLSLGAAISTGDAVKVAAPPNATIPGEERVTLWEAHARWTPGKADLSALYAHGAISNLGLANAANPGSPNPIPSEFYGYFLQAAYDAWDHGDYRLAPFVRWERYNLGARYAGTTGPNLPTGLVPLSSAAGDYGYWPQVSDKVWTVGANFYTTSHVVLKADYQWFHENSDFTRFDLGLGVAF